MHTNREELGPCGWEGYQARALLLENCGGERYHCSGRHLHRDRFHRRSVPGHAVMERKAQYAGEGRSQPVDGLGRDHRRCLHCPNVLLMGDPLRRRNLGRRRQCSDTNVRLASPSILFSLANLLPSIEVNFAIIGACAPVMRPLYLHLRSRFRPIHDSLGSSQRTSPSKLRWYTPPSSTPWYKRIFRAPAPVDQLDGRPSELSGRQEVSQQPIPPKPPEPAIRSSWPMRQVEKLDRKWQVEKLNDRWQGAEKPENVTWVKKDDLEAKDSDSFELPMQGARKSEYTNNHDEDTDSDAFKTYRYNRG